MTDVLISYARRDGADHAARLDTVLSQRGFSTWRDTRGIDPAKDFTAEIEMAIKAADFVVVCITPDVARPDSFVRRELQYALLSQKPVLVARFADALPPIHVIDNTWIDFFRGWDAGFEQFCGYLRGELGDLPRTAPPPDPFRPYVERLYQRTVDFLDRAVIRLIDLSADDAPDAVERPQAGAPRRQDMIDQLYLGHGLDAPAEDAPADVTEPFATFAAAFEHYGGRVLLLGEPGAGKTITLTAFTRDAAARRLEDPDAPLPLFGLVASWDAAEQPPLANWLADGNTLDPDAVQAVIAAGEALLLLDGLDELGGEREDPATKERYDPRRRFMDALAELAGAHDGTQIAVTCRVEDYAAIGKTIALRGAVTLRPLNAATIRAYLETGGVGDLWAALEADSELLAVAQTPLLLSLFAFAYRDQGEAARQLRNLRASPGDLRDAIFRAYVEQRYAHEERRLRFRGEAMPFTLEKIRQVLGAVAVRVATSIFRQKNELSLHDFDASLDAVQTPEFIELAVRLHLITPLGGGTFLFKKAYRFIHLLLRDYFAFGYSIRNLKHRDGDVRQQAIMALGAIGDSRAVGPLESELNLVPLEEMHLFSTHRIAEALGRLGEPGLRVLLKLCHSAESECRLTSIFGLIKHEDGAEYIAQLLNDENSTVRHTAADALGELEDVRAVEPLIGTLKDEEYRIREKAAWSLGRIADPRAIDPLFEALGDRSRYVGYAAADALARIESDRTVQLLETALAQRKRNKRIRYFAALMLRKLGGQKSADTLRIALRDPSSDVRATAACHLGIMRDVKAVEMLICLLEDRENTSLMNKRRVCVFAVEALERIGTPEALTAVDKWWESQLPK